MTVSFLAATVTDFGASVGCGTAVGCGAAVGSNVGVGVAVGVGCGILIFWIPSVRKVSLRSNQTSV